MNANELAESLETWAKDVYGGGKTLTDAANMLRQQQAEIETLKEIVERFISEWTNGFKNYEYNSDEPEENKLRDDVFAILRKASEK